MSWRYAAVKTTLKDGSPWWAIKEVYNIDGEITYTENDITFGSETKESLVQSLIMVLNDIALKESYSVGSDGNLVPNKDEPI